MKSVDRQGAEVEVVATVGEGQEVGAEGQGLDPGRRNTDIPPGLGPGNAGERSTGDPGQDLEGPEVGHDVLEAGQGQDPINAKGQNVPGVGQDLIVKI